MNLALLIARTMVGTSSKLFNSHPSVEKYDMFKLAIAKNFMETEFASDIF